MDRYEKALELARAYYDKDANVFLDTIFPELKESEDERIRKAIIDALYSHTNSINVLSSKGYSMDDVIAYLEKQKEQPMSATEVLVRAGLKPYKDGNQWCILAGDNIQEGICGFGDTIDDALYQFLMEVLELQKKQKPAEWSEEDVDMLNSCISSIEEAKENRYAYKETDGDTSYDYEIAWLKSIRPSWKPSYEQMYILNWVANILLNHNGIVEEEASKKLQSLYNDLKQL